MYLTAMQAEAIADLEISGSAWGVYAALLVYADGKTGICYPSVNKLAKLARVSRPTVFRALDELEKAGLVTREKRPEFRTTVYTVRVPKGSHHDTEGSHQLTPGVSPVNPTSTTDETQTNHITDQGTDQLTKHPQPATGEGMEKPDLFGDSRGTPDPTPPTVSVTKPKPLPVTAELVESVYQEYPRKKGKREALRAIKAAIQRVMKRESLTPGDATSYLITRTRSYADSVQGKDLKYVPYPQRYYKRDQYLDEPDTEQTHGQHHDQEFHRIANDWLNFASA